MTLSTTFFFFYFNNSKSFSFFLPEHNHLDILQHDCDNIKQKKRKGMNLITTLFAQWRKN